MTLYNVDRLGTVTLVTVLQEHVTLANPQSWHQRVTYQASIHCLTLFRVMFLSPSASRKLQILIEAKVETIILVEEANVTLVVVVAGCYIDLLSPLMKDVALFSVQPTLFAIEGHEVPSRNRSTAFYCLLSSLDVLFFACCYGGFKVLH